MKIQPKFLLRSKQLRKIQTPWEDILWHYLRAKRFANFRFRRQYVIGNYIADFCCCQKKLVIELDGGQHSEEVNLKKDPKRTAI